MNWLNNIIPAVLYIKKDCDNCQVFLEYLKTQIALFPFVLFIPLDLTTLTIDSQDVLQSKYGAIPLPSLLVRDQMHKSISPEDDMSSIFLNAMVEQQQQPTTDVFGEYMFSHGVEYEIFTDHFYHHFTLSHEKEWMPLFFMFPSIQSLFQHENLIHRLQDSRNPSILLIDLSPFRRKNKSEIERFWDLAGRIQAEVYHVNAGGRLVLCHPLFYLNRVKDCHFYYGNLTIDPSRVKFNLLSTFVPLLRASSEITKRLSPKNRKCQNLQEILETIREL